MRPPTMEAGERGRELMEALLSERPVRGQTQLGMGALLGVCGVRLPHLPPFSIPVSLQSSFQPHRPPALGTGQCHSQSRRLSLSPPAKSLEQSPLSKPEPCQPREGRPLRGLRCGDSGCGPAPSSGNRTPEGPSGVWGQAPLKLPLQGRFRASPPAPRPGISRTGTPSLPLVEWAVLTPLLNIDDENPDQLPPAAPHRG